MYFKILENGPDADRTFEIVEYDEDNKPRRNWPGYGSYDDAAAALESGSFLPEPEHQQLDWRQSQLARFLEHEAAIHGHREPYQSFIIDVLQRHGKNRLVEFFDDPKFARFFNTDS